MKRKSPTPKTNTTKSPSQRKSTSSRKVEKSKTVGSPRVSKGAVSDRVLSDRRASDPNKNFSPTLGDIDLHLFGEGKHLRIYDELGAHVITHEGKRGIAFAVGAPAADRVSVVGNFNDWDCSR